MDEKALYEKIGRMQCAAEAKDAAFDGLLRILANVLSGEVCPSRVMVNLTEGRCDVVPEGQRPAEPAGINGLPEIVVGASVDDWIEADSERVKKYLRDHARLRDN